jgi:hypothetical protein
MTLVSSTKLLCQWCGNECSSWRWWPKVGSPSNREQNAWSVMQNWSYCNTKIFLGAIRHHAGSCQKHYKQSDTEEVERVTATQGTTACNSAPCGFLLKTLHTEWCTTSRVSLLQQKCHHPPQIWSLGDSANFESGHAAQPHKVNENS